MARQRFRPIIFALLAAVGYSISIPGEKLLLDGIEPIMTGSLIYLGSGISFAAIRLFDRKKQLFHAEAPLTKQEAPWVIAAILGLICAPILMLNGLNLTTSSNASLLSNFELVGTTLIALLFFKEAIGKRMWAAIGLVVVASCILTISDTSTLTFNLGSLLILAGTIAWSLVNNFGRMISIKDPVQYIIIKGLSAGSGLLIIALAIGENIPPARYFAGALLVGFVSYGLATFFGMRAQRELGASRAVALMATSPFLGVVIAFFLFRDPLTVQFLVALVVMAAGTLLAASERHEHLHEHEPMSHEHRHRHDDGHHNHTHEPPVLGAHSHSHDHESLTHSHPHTPDFHHRHTH
jgi:drug/metabolite transporter (DMT)-like permease